MRQEQQQQQPQRLPLLINAYLDIKQIQMRMYLSKLTFRYLFTLSGFLSVCLIYINLCILPRSFFLFCVIHSLCHFVSNFFSFDLCACVCVCVRVELVYTSTFVFFSNSWFAIRIFLSQWSLGFLNYILTHAKLNEQTPMTHFRRVTRN